MKKKKEDEEAMIEKISEKFETRLREVKQWTLEKVKWTAEAIVKGELNEEVIEMMKAVEEEKNKTGETLEETLMKAVELKRKEEEKNKMGETWEEQRENGRKGARVSPRRGK